MKSIIVILFTIFSQTSFANKDVVFDLASHFKKEILIKNKVKKDKVKNKKLILPRKKVEMLNLKSQIRLSGQGKGGGIGFLCGDQVFLADTHNLITSGDLKKLDSFSEKTLIEAAFYNHNKRYPIFSKKLKKAYEELIFKFEDHVLIAGDDQIKFIPNGCQKIAIGNQDLKTGIVSVNRTFFNSLSTIDKAFFKFHEAYIQFYNGLDDTTIVRELVGKSLIKIFTNTESSIHKFSGMLNSFNLSIMMACEEVTYKVLKSTFLVHQKKEYKNCIKKSLYFIGNEIGINFDQHLPIWKMEELIKNKVKDREDELKVQTNAYCPQEIIEFGAYVGASPDMHSLYCRYNILGALVELYFESNRLEDLSCGAGFSSCKGIEYSREELLKMVSE